MGTCNSTSNHNIRTEKRCVTLPSTEDLQIDLSPKQAKAFKCKESDEQFSLKKITSGITKSSSTKTVCQVPFLTIPSSMMYPLRRTVPTLHYTIKDKVGIGTYGTVFQAENEELHTKVALKKIIKTPTTCSDFKSELSVLRNCSHPNIITLHECYETKKAYYLSTTLFQYDLYSQIGKKYTEWQLADRFYQLCSALTYLHKKQVIHRDLKLENIIIFDTEFSNKTKETFYNIKLIDFGTTTTYPKHDKEIVGSAYYLAPEVICDNYYTDKCDIWSVGIILFMMLTQKSPYKVNEGDSLDGFIKKKELYSELKNYYTELYIDDIYESICCSLGNKYIEYIDFVSSCVDKKLLLKKDKYLKDAYDSISNDVNSDIYKILFDNNEI